MDQGLVIISLCNRLSVWHRFGTKPLPELMLIYYQVNPQEQIKNNFGEILVNLQTNSTMKMHLKMSASWLPFVQASAC